AQHSHLTSKKGSRGSDATAVSVGGISALALFSSGPASVSTSAPGSGTKSVPSEVGQSNTTKVADVGVWPVALRDAYDSPAAVSRTAAGDAMVGGEETV